MTLDERIEDFMNDFSGGRAYDLVKELADRYEVQRLNLLKLLEADQWCKCECVARSKTEENK